MPVRSALFCGAPRGVRQRVLVFLSRSEVESPRAEESACSQQLDGGEQTSIDLRDARDLYELGENPGEPSLGDFGAYCARGAYADPRVPLSSGLSVDGNQESIDLREARDLYELGENLGEPSLGDFGAYCARGAYAEPRAPVSSGLSVDGSQESCNVLGDTCGEESSGGVEGIATDIARRLGLGTAIVRAVLHAVAVVGVAPQEKRGRGRPIGAKDKKPRKSKHRAATADDDTSARLEPSRETSRETSGLSNAEFGIAQLLAGLNLITEVHISQIAMIITRDAGTVGAVVYELRVSLGATGTNQPGGGAQQDAQGAERVERRGRPKGSRDKAPRSCKSRPAAAPKRKPKPAGKRRRAATHADSSENTAVSSSDSSD